MLLQCVDEPDREAAGRGGIAHRPDAVRHGDEAPRAAHTSVSQPPDSRVAALMMPTSE